MNKESTLYDYTKSAEELRQFELREKCSKIAMEYERFNLENDVYKMFGEWLLEQAKTGYSATFTGKILDGFLKGRGVSAPRKVTIKAKESDYDSCERLRVLSGKFYRNHADGYESDYRWYTLWKIAKAYNKQNGCIVVDAPSYLTSSGSVAIVLDWSKEAQDCITHEKWAENVNSKFDVIGCALESGVIASVISFVVLVVLALFISDEQFLIPGFFALCLMFVLCPVFYPKIKKVKISSLTDETAIKFYTHCKMIEETRYSRYNIRLDEQRDWAGNCLGWF